MDFSTIHQSGYNQSDRLRVSRQFYGTCLRGLLEASGRKPAMIVDQNPFLQGTSIAGVPVVSPGELPMSINTLLVGLKPQSAKQIIQGVECWQGRNLDLIYLE